MLFHTYGREWWGSVPVPYGPVVDRMGGLAAVFLFSCLIGQFRGSYFLCQTGCSSQLNKLLLPAPLSSAVRAAVRAVQPTHRGMPRLRLPAFSLDSRVRSRCSSLYRSEHCETRKAEKLTCCDLGAAVVRNFDGSIQKVRSGR